jgi:hypothetical protein
MFNKSGIGSTILVALALVTPCSSAFAWGDLGHRIVAKVGAQLSEDGDLFWGANLEPLMTFANTPDFMWKRGNTSADEKPTHWFQFDVYSPSGTKLPTMFESYASVVKKYSEPFVVENGTGLWRIQQFYLSAKEAIERGDTETGLQWAGAMAHYVGDLSQPLHVTHNYDGQLTNQKGIHSWFESVNLERGGAADVEASVFAKARVLLDSKEFRAQASGDLMRAVLLESQRSAQFIDTVLQNDKKLGRTGKGSEVQLDLAIDRIADGAASYALLLSRLWKEGGQQDKAVAYKPGQPEWQAPDFSRTLGEESLSSSASFASFSSRAASSVQDCN